MDWNSVFSKANISIQLGSLIASVILHGHDEQVNEQISSKALTIVQLIQALVPPKAQ
jgi:hypothetical protein